jgi:hypothetical protein
MLTLLQSPPHILILLGMSEILSGVFPHHILGKGNSQLNGRFSFETTESSAFSAKGRNFT